MTAQINKIIRTRALREGGLNRKPLGGIGGPVNNQTTILIMSIISGMYAVGCGIYLYYYLSARRAKSGTTTGIVVRIERRFFQTRSPMSFHPVVEFTDKHGGKHSTESWFGSIPSFYKEGDAVKVLYNPDNPSEAEIGSGLEAINRQYIIPIFLFVTVTISLFSSVLLLGVYILFQSITVN